MSPLRTAAGRRRAARVLVALAAAAACFGAALAYAATRSGGGHHKEHREEQRERLLRPELIEAPPEATAVSDPQFRFRVSPRRPLVPPPVGGPGPARPEASSRRFQCRVDGGAWEDCRSPDQLAGLAPGPPRFAVRAFNREGRVGEAAAVSWQHIEAPSAAPAPAPPGGVEPVAPVVPKEFSIEALAEPEDLSPGFPPTPIPVRITNPNPVPIEVTALSVAVG